MKTRNSPLHTKRGRRLGRIPDAFSLLEVIIACAIFFMVAFALLELVTRGLIMAKSLQVREPDPGLVLSALSLTNAFEEGTMSGDYDEIAAGLYPSYRWEALVTEVGSNGLFQIEVFSHSPKKNKGALQVTGYFWRPNSKPGSATKGRP